MSNPLAPRPSSGHLIEARLLGGSRHLKWWLIIGGVALVILVSIGWVGAVIALVALVVIGIVLRTRLVAALRWKPAVLEVPVVPFALGSKPVIVYRRKPRRTADIAACSVHCTVVCEERATYRQGSSTRTDTSQVFEQTFTGDGTGTAQGLEAQIRLNISSNAGAPTFDLGDNEVHWYLEAVTTGPGLPNDKQRFPIMVGPLLDIEQRNVMGDR